jgi:hypothetical protein
MDDYVHHQCVKRARGREGNKTLFHRDEKPLTLYNTLYIQLRVKLPAE